MPTIPTDDLFSQQWYLHNTTMGEFDLNVIDVWDDYTGAGVDIGVIDDGFDRDHSEFSNFDFTRDFNFAGAGGGGLSAEARNADDNQGTAVMGLIGADENDGGVVGVSYDSALIAYRIAFDSNFAADTVQSINRSVIDNVEVINMSIGHTGDFVTGTENDAAITAFQNAIDNGRGGLGSILVKSAGDDRGTGDTDDTNDDSWAAHRSTITVAAVDADGTISSYSTQGASLLISAFGSPGGSNGTIVTSDRANTDGYNMETSANGGDYTDSFNGTSAAAAMVSGVVGLMLEANANLGWRDVQEILAYSARHTGTDIGNTPTGDELHQWQWNAANNWNGGGLHFSNDYGFGLIDAHAAVRIAEMWDGSQTSSNENSLDIDWGFTTPQIIPNGDLSGAEFTFTQLAIRPVEHVRVSIDFSTTFIGDVEIYLISPSGTESQLIADTEIDTASNADWNLGGGTVWEFTSNAFWGERSFGVWTVRVVDDVAGDVLTVYDLDLTIYADSFDSNNDTYVFTNEYSDYVGQGNHSATIEDINGGTGDSINAAAVTSDTTIELAFSGNMIDGVAITNIQGIENIFTGDGQDIVGGNGLANILRTGRGNDYVDGREGADTIDAGAGDDTVIYDANDIASNVTGGDGIDTLRVITSNSGTAPFAYDLVAGSFELATHVQFDDDGTEFWSSTERNYNDAWTLISQIGSTDDNRSWRTDIDVAGSQWWSSVTQWYQDSFRNFLQFTNYVRDDGSQVNTSWDFDSSQWWSSFTNFFNTSGVLTNTDGSADDGRYFSSTNDIASNQWWSRYTQWYDTQDPGTRRLINEEGTADDGRTWTTTYDVDDIYSWTNQTNWFDSSGTLIETVTV